MRNTLLTAIILLIALAVFAESPIVTNVTASQRTDGSKIVDITYDVSDAENDTLTISVKISDDGGATFSIEPNEANLTGDFGSGIMHRITANEIEECGGVKIESLDFFKKEFYGTLKHNIKVMYEEINRNLNKKFGISYDEL